MRISELANATQTSVKTIRYYEQVGLIIKATRSDNGYRQYSDKDTKTLIFIRRCRALNMAISDIKQLLLLQQNPAASCEAVDSMVKKQLDDIRQQQKELALLENTLSSLAASCANQKIEDCCILSQLQAN